MDNAHNSSTDNQNQVGVNSPTDGGIQANSPTTTTPKSLPTSTSDTKKKDPLAALEELLKKTPRTDKRNKKVQEQKSKQLAMEKQKIATKIEEQQRRDNQQLAEKRQLVSQVVKTAQDSGQVYKTEASSQSDNKDDGFEIKQLKKVKI